jgi:hypothetical protein
MRSVSDLQLLAFASARVCKSDTDQLLMLYLLHIYVIDNLPGDVLFTFSRQASLIASLICIVGIL